jgi:uncharacterized protein YicC (UPF0701 family)
LETKEEYRASREATLEELRPQVWMVKQKVEEMENETRAEYNELFQALHAKLEGVEENLREIEGASEETWQHLKARADGALSDLINSVGNVLSRMG